MKSTNEAIFGKSKHHHHHDLLMADEAEPMTLHEDMKRQRYATMAARTVSLSAFCTSIVA